MTDRYAVFGNPVAHSKSPQIHALFAQQTGQDMRYEAILAPLDGFENSVREFISAGGRGANVTVPFKGAAFRLCTEHTARAKAIGVVNTLTFTNDKVRGDNTDGVGLLSDIEHNLGFSIVDKRVLLLGAGGAAQGVLPPLLERTKKIQIANRDTRKADELAKMFAQGGFGALAFDYLGAISGGGYKDLEGKTFDLIINATSAGLQDAALPLPSDLFAPGCLAYEMLYGRETPFMRQAAKAGARVVDGLGMLVEQAAEAFYVWRGVRPDTAPVLLALRAA